jgi:DUF4097 and DUF4098 domain-containing protein YvlB
MMVTKMKWVAALLLAVGLLGTGTGLLAYRSMAAETTMNLTADSPPAAARAAVQPSPAAAIQDEPEDKDATAPQKTEKAKKKAKEDDKRITAKEVLTKSFKTGKSPRLIVELHNGAVEITANAESGIDAKVTKEARAETDAAAKEALKSLEVKMEQEGDTVRIKAGKLEGEKRTIHVVASAVLRVPPGTTLDVQTANGAVHLTGAAGNARIRTANGAIHVKDCKSTLDLHTANGAIHVEGGAGQLTMKTVNGGLHIQGTKAVVNAQTNNGGIHFDGSLGEGQQSLNTHNGSISLSLPADSRFRIEADTRNGRVTSEFAVQSTDGKSKTRLKGSVGESPSTTLKLHTENGSIILKRQKPGKEE